MEVNAVPFYDTSDNPTNCCPRFNPEGWNDRRLNFEDKRFVRATTKSIMHVPINMGKVFPKTFLAITDAGADDPNDVLVLSRDISPWKGEHYFAVSKDVPGEEMAFLSGRYMTKVFEGPYKDAKKWREDLKGTASGDEEKSPDIFFFYTTCPKCAKFYGKNYVVGLVEEQGSNWVTAENVEVSA